MKLRYYDAHPNVGDALNEWLWPKIFGQDLCKHPDIDFVGIGSILSKGNVFGGQDKVIFGSGVREESFDGCFNALRRLSFVRGPHSASATGLPYITDSAYCLALCGDNYHNLCNSPKTIDTVYVPYFRHVPMVNWRLFEHLTGIRVLPSTSHPLMFLHILSQAKYVISTSMHGAILSDVLRIPWSGVRLDNLLAESWKTNRLKWSDYLHSIELEDHVVDEWKLRLLPGQPIRNALRLAVYFRKQRGQLTHCLSQDSVFNSHLERLEEAVGRLKCFLTEEQNKRDESRPDIIVGKQSADDNRETSPTYILLPHNEVGNDYPFRLTQLLFHGLENVRVVLDPNEFWRPSRHYHFVMVNFLYYLFTVPLSKPLQYKQAIEAFKKRNTRLVFIRHDTYFHWIRNKHANELMDFFNIQADIVFHLGQYSIEEHHRMYGKIAGQQQVLLPHPLYTTFDFNRKDTPELRKRYGFRKEDFIVFVPGYLRHREEYDLARRLTAELKVPQRKQMLMQSVHIGTVFGRRLSQAFLHFSVDRWLMRSCRVASNHRISDDELSDLFSIADLVLIPRAWNLNSGNITLAAQFGKPTVVTESGDLTEWAKNLGMYVVKRSTYTMPSVQEIEQMSRSNMAERLSQMASDQQIIDILSEALGIPKRNTSVPPKK